MKTLMLWREFPDENLLPRFLELEGDYSRFNGVYINEYTIINEYFIDKEFQKLQRELFDIIYGKDGNRQQNFINAPTQDWDIFIHCGIYI